MFFWSSLLLAAAVSIDGLGAGFAYGVRKLYVPLTSLFIISISSSMALLAAMFTGRTMASLFSARLSSLLGGGILILVGVYILWGIFHQGKDSPEPREGKTSLAGLLRDPEKADFDSSGSISSREAAVLGLALAMDAFGAGIGAAMTGHSPLMTCLMVGLCKLLFVAGGVAMGKRYAGNLDGKKASWMAGGGIDTFRGYQYNINDSLGNTARERMIMIAVGLTGGIATGKSTVAAVLKGQGCILLDADEMAREVVAPNSPGLEALCREFGTGILNESGELNRRYLGDIVFRDPAAKTKLETILHPLIISKIRASLEEYSQDFGRVVVVDAPLLFETGLDSLMDCTLVVYTDEETQHKRLMKRDKLGEEEARLRIASQMPLKEKVKKADFTIDNGGSLEAAEEQAMKIWQKLQDMAREAGGRGLQA